MKIENGVTNFAVYEDATEYYGMAEVTLPEITQISEEVKGRASQARSTERLSDTLKLCP